MAPMGVKVDEGGSSIDFTVLAESEDDNEHRWEGSCAPHVPLRILAEAWATRHNIPASAVALEDEHGNRLDLTKPPTEYGWQVDAQEKVRLMAFPVDEEYMEQAAPAPPSSAPPVQSAGSPAEETAPASAGSKREGASLEEEQAKGKRTRSAQPSGSSSAGKNSKSGASPASSSAPGAPSEGKSEASKASAKQAQAVPKQKTDSPKPKPKPKASDAEAKPRKAEGFGANDGDLPNPDEAIVFCQTNPKKAGGTAWDRYESYKKAKTVKEAMELGAAKGDIAYDWKKGFFKRK
eukprot:TRINITY_DN12928_c0_g1_i1.p1 TRINITY_DN12928_c0_g1~~TRINITY_DN12928_c0_g1_i1.p1  ORF type:complete len:292 (-),score=79.17 TRINITY_DN12928_c0_g1_i1:29-904(-)